MANRSYSKFTADKLIRDHREAVAVGERSGTTKFSWGAGLVLAIGPSGNASWIARVTAPDGKRRDIGVGKYGDLSIEDARKAVAEHKGVAREGRDPKAAKDAARDAARTVAQSFEQSARQAYAERAGTFKNDKHRAQWISSLEQYAFPKLGKLPMATIGHADVTKAITPLWTAKPETARRVLQRIATVFAWAVAHEMRSAELPVTAIKMGLSKQSRKVAHHKAVAIDDAHAVYAAIVAKGIESSISAPCLRFLILTAARFGEAAGAAWAEIDMDAQTWTVPAERMKMGKPHVVPLSSEAMALLESLPRIPNKEGLIFPSPMGKRLSDVAVSKMLRATGADATVHGWRSTFRDWAAEKTTFPNEVCEMALAHAVGNKVEAAYRRGDLLAKRRDLMQAWAGFLNNEAATVTSLDEARRLKESSG